MQIVYISRRPEVLADTIKQVRRFMPFIDATVVACPEAVAHEVRAIQAKTLTVVTDRDLLGDSGRGLADQQQRTLTLRSRLIASPVVQQMFIMSDDDSRPLREIPKETFLEDGRYHNYYFYDLSRWLGNETIFDRGQHNTRAVLSVNGYPLLSYASHMPQIIDRNLFLEAIERFSTAIAERALCEWSLYFNYAQRVYPDRFRSPRPYLTFCWPDAPYTWPLYTQPGRYYFENFYSRYYEAGGIFHGVSAAPAKTSAEQVLREKMSRWQRVADARARGHPTLSDPWVGGSRIRLCYLNMLRPWIRLWLRLGLRAPSERARFLVGFDPAKFNK